MEHKINERELAHEMMNLKPNYAGFLFGSILMATPDQAQSIRNPRRIQ